MMAKTRLLLSIIFLCGFSPVRAQTNYCTVMLASAGGQAVTIVIHTGSDKELYSRIRAEDSSFLHRTFAYTEDVINWMAGHKWELVTTDRNRMYFKRKRDE